MMLRGGFGGWRWRFTYVVARNGYKWFDKGGKIIVEGIFFTRRFYGK